MHAEGLVMEHHLDRKALGLLQRSGLLAVRQLVIDVGRLVAYPPRARVRVRVGVGVEFEVEGTSMCYLVNSRCRRAMHSIEGEIRCED